jgi:3-hydroxyacyl-CoA dehydrogenase/enoyl-CoA hydratase/3-hydroxybutyryl-CoA epimerase
MSSPKTLRLEHRDDGVAVLWIDDPDDTVNTLKRELAAELDEVLRELESSTEVRALVIISGKPDNFIAGANLDMLLAVESAAEARALSELSQGLQQRLASLPVPTVAAIHGAALGGGLELALACDARVASDHAVTRLGLPEVQLGLLPGGGGTQRLPRLVGAPTALDLLLTGRQLDARRALGSGLLDRVVARDELLRCAVDTALAMKGLRRRGARPLRAPPASSPFTPTGLLQLLLAGNPLGRHWLFARVSRETRAKTRGNYPAPERILGAVRAGLEGGMDAGLSAEAKAFGDLVVSPQSRQLVRIFFATRELKSDSGVDDASVVADPVQSVGVLGAGLMGVGIAYLCAVKAETRVWVKERDQESLEQGLGRLRGLIGRQMSRGRITEETHRAIHARIGAGTDYADVAQCQVIIEAVFEDLALKRRVLADVEAVGNEDTIFASNTSAIPIADIAASSSRPHNVIGMHYFSPAERMPLLEVIATGRTAPRAVATCVALGKRQGKTVIVVGDGPGFYTSRILAPYLNEAAWLMSEGMAVDAIDAALVDFGFPIGPLALLDEVGIDVASKVSVVLAQAFGARMQAPPGMQRLVDQGRQGKKSGRGFYRYVGAGSGSRRADGSVYELLGVEPRGGVDGGRVAERCMLQMVNEAARCLEEGILRSPRDGDIGAVFGLGFPPFLGGPFRYVDALGAGDVVERLKALVEAHGSRFTPAPSLLALAEAGGRFFDAAPRRG